MRDFCPACAREVEYDGSGYDASCNVCGRTKSVAEETVQLRKEQAKRMRLKPLWIALATIGAVIFVVTNVYIGRSERMLETAVSSAVQVTGIVFIAWLVRKFRK